MEKNNSNENENLFEWTRSRPSKVQALELSKDIGLKHVVGHVWLYILQYIVCIVQHFELQSVRCKNYKMKMVPIEILLKYIFCW